MSNFIKIKKQNQDGFIHHLIPLLIFVALFGVIGFYVFTKIFADTSAPAAPAATTAASDTTQEIIADVSAPGTWCMNDQHDSEAAENPVNTSICDGSHSQHWSYNSSDNELELYFPSGEHCLEPQNGATAAGTVVVMDTCNNHPAQNWVRYNGGYKNQSAIGKCLGVYGGVTGAQLRINTCNSDQAQNWTPSTFKDDISSTCGASVNANPTQAKCVAKIVMTQSPYNLDPNKQDSGGQSNYSCLVDLWTRESSWDRTIANPSSGAYGIAQALGHGDGDGGEYPAAYDSANPPTSSAITQIRWGLSYIESSYGPNGGFGYTGPVSISPCTAWAHETGVGWYGIDQTTGLKF